jgi:Peptidase inhibitor I78 family
MTLKTISQIGLCAAIGAVAGFQIGHAADANPTTIDGLNGYVLRVIHPGEMTSMLYRPGRVNITVDKDNKITGVSFY